MIVAQIKWQVWLYEEMKQNDSECELCANSQYIHSNNTWSIILLELKNVSNDKVYNSTRYCPSVILCMWYCFGHIHFFTCRCTSSCICSFMPSVLFRYTPQHTKHFLYTGKNSDTDITTLVKILYTQPRRSWRMHTIIK